MLRVRFDVAPHTFHFSVRDVESLWSSRHPIQSSTATAYDSDNQWDRDADQLFNLRLDAIAFKRRRRRECDELLFGDKSAEA